MQKSEMTNQEIDWCLELMFGLLYCVDGIVCLVQLDGGKLVESSSIEKIGSFPLNFMAFLRIGAVVKIIQPAQSGLGEDKAGKNDGCSFN